MYEGEVNIFQEDLDCFLKVAEELKLKGLTGSEAENEDNENNHKHPEHQTKKNMSQKVTYRHHLETDVATKERKFDIF